MPLTRQRLQAAGWAALKPFYVFIQEQDLATLIMTSNRPGKLVRRIPPLPKTILANRRPTPDLKTKTGALEK